MDRQLIGYLIIAAMVLAAIAAIVYLRHNSRERQYRRRNFREQAAYDKLRAEKTEGDA